MLYTVFPKVHIFIFFKGYVYASQTSWSGIDLLLKISGGCRNEELFFFVEKGHGVFVTSSEVETWLRIWYVESRPYLAVIYSFCKAADLFSLQWKKKRCMLKLQAGKLWDQVVFFLLKMTFANSLKIFAQREVSFVRNVKAFQEEKCLNRKPVCSQLNENNINQLYNQDLHTTLRYFGLKNTFFFFVLYPKSHI